MHYDDEILVEWTCPKCKTTQTDDYAWTSQPHCCCCETDSYWEDVFSPELLKQVNDELALLDATSYVEEENDG